MAHGIPVVATKIRAQGFEAVHGKQMMITDEADEFADCVIKLLQNDALQYDMGIAGQKLNSAICSHDAVKVKIEELVGACYKLVTGKSHHSFRQRIISIASDIRKGFSYLKREGIKKTLRKILFYLNSGGSF